MPTPTPPPPTPGPGYFVLLLLNAIGLFTAVGLFLIEITGDPAATLVGQNLGAPILVAQLLLATLPSCAYLATQRATTTRGRKATLITLALAAPLLELLGLILARTLSTPRG